MAHPKRQHSRQRQRKRRTHDGLTVRLLVECPQCDEKTLPHRICPTCGYYKGRKVVETQAEAAGTQSTEE